MDEVIIPLHKDFHIWQQAKILDLTPVIVLDVLYMLFGVVGNSVVAYVCLFHLQRTVINSFVLSLAILELLGCILTIPVDITELLNSYAFDFPLLCKSERYFRKVIIFSTGCILLGIAVERYKRIVKPHEPHMTLFEFKIAIVGAIIFSAVLATPEAILAGNETIQTSSGNGIVCSVYTSDKYRFSMYPQLWGFLVVVIYVLSIVTIAIIYSLVALKIWKRGKVHTNRRSRSNTPDSTIQRRVRCYSYHQKRSEELDPFSRTCSSLYFQHRLEPDSFTMQAIQERHKRRLYHLCTLPRAKVNHTDGKSVRPVQEDVGGQEFKADSNNSVNKYSQDNGGYNSVMNTSEMQENYDISVPSQTVFRSQTLCHRNYIRNRTSSNDIHQLLNNNCTNRCKENCTPHRAASKEDMNRQETSTQSTAFIEAVINKLNDTQHIEKLQSRCFYRNFQAYNRPASPVGSLHRRLGYSRKRTTFIMFVMTLTTVFSHLPHIIALLYSFTHPGAEAHLTADECVMFHVAWNSFFISLASHPFMYGFWNGRFKSALCVLLSGCQLRKN
ncbi:unnamed protein product [Candidula unifasciata]|uniref:G-protein coupled receptors family 1 profile domain-containing protein n=1 Tax=Candidula unifasciata TaxID=100452 RepID=A0A8S3Z421_9EUPU|nr:unnamed protein product [Candidula unifasciata]